MSATDGLRPRSVVAIPLYNGAATLDRAVGSLLEQEDRDFALVLVDDASSDRTAALAERWAERDPRVIFVRNDRRLGLIGNWRRCFELARTLFPEAEYFAWASDHDRWRPDWLGSLVEALRRRPEAVLAFPRPHQLTPEGGVTRAVSGVDTAETPRPLARMRAMSGSVGAGYMVYGLFRSSALAEVGPFPYVLVPDRLLLIRLSLAGRFVRVEKALWHRHKVERKVLREHQRATLFSGRAPWWTRMPSRLCHGLLLFLDLAVRGIGLPHVSRARGAAYGLVHLSDEARRTLRRTSAATAIRRRRRAWRRARRRRGRKRRKPAKRVVRCLARAGGRSARGSGRHRRDPAAGG